MPKCTQSTPWIPQKLLILNICPLKFLEASGMFWKFYRYTLQMKVCNVSRWKFQIKPFAFNNPRRGQIFKVGFSRWAFFEEFLVWTDIYKIPTWRFVNSHPWNYGNRQYGNTYPDIWKYLLGDMEIPTWIYGNTHLDIWKYLPIQLWVASVEIKVWRKVFVGKSLSQL